MNEANLLRLIEHVDSIEEKIPNWENRNCFHGMIARIEGKELEDYWMSTDAIESFLGSDWQTACRLSYHCPGDMFWPETTLDQQKAAIKHALTHDGHWPDTV